MKETICYGLPPVGIYLFLTLCGVNEGTAMIIAAVVFIVVILAMSAHKSSVTGSYKKCYSRKRTAEYYRKLYDLQHEYKAHTWESSPSQKTGMFSDEYIRAKKALDNEYAKEWSDEYAKIKEREEKYDRGEHIDKWD